MSQPRTKAKSAGRVAAKGPRDAVGHALHLLVQMTDAETDGWDRKWGVREIAEKVEMSPAAAYRLLLKFTERGLIQRTHSGQYHIGSEMYRIALKLTSGLRIRNIGMPIVHELMSTCNETAFLGLYDSGRKHMMFVAGAYSDHALRYIVAQNEWLPVHHGASGFAILAFLPKEERRAIVEEMRLPAFTDRTITDPALLEKELARVRARGYARTCGHHTPGAVAIAAPVWGPGGRVLGSLHLSMPESRFNASREKSLAALVMKYAGQITDALGGRRVLANGGAR